MKCYLCQDTKKVKCIDEPRDQFQTLEDAIENGQNIVELDCALCQIVDSMIAIDYKE